LGNLISCTRGEPEGMKRQDKKEGRTIHTTCSTPKKRFPGRGEGERRNPVTKRGGGD